jgi:hypothetical protein
MQEDSALFNVNPLDLTYSHMTESRVTYSNSTANVSHVNAGTYDVKVIGLNETFNNSNYMLANSAKHDIKYTIQKSTISFTWDTTKLTYNGKTQQFSATILESSVFNNVLSGQDEISLEFADNSKINAGTYTATISKIVGESFANYTLPQVVQSNYTIHPLVAVIEWNSNNQYIYSGNPHTVVPTAKNAAFREDTALIDDLGMAISNHVKTGIGSFQARVSSLTNSNYTLTEVSNFNWSIVKKTITPVWTNDTSFVYTGTIRTVTLRLTGIAENELSALAISAFTTSRPITRLLKTSNDVLLEFDIKDNGSYTINVKINNSNYILDSTSRTIVISPKTITPVWTNDTSFVYTGSNSTVSVTLTGIAENELSALTTSAFITSRPITRMVKIGNSVVLEFDIMDNGSYTINVKINNTNYTLDSTSITIVILPKPITATWTTSTDKIIDTFDGDEKTITLTIEGIILGEDVADYLVLNTNIVSMINNFDGKVSIIFSVFDADEYDFIANFIGTNYLLENSRFTYTISKRVLNVSYEGPVNSVYDGEEKTRIVKISNIAFNDLNSASIEELNYQLSDNTSIDISILDNELIISFTGIEIGEYFLRSFNLFQNENYETVEINEIFSIVEN